MKRLFCLDSGVFINAWRKHYPPDVFPSIWGHFADLLDQGCILVPRAVFDEIETGGDDLCEWLKQFKAAVHSPDKDVIESVRRGPVGYRSRTGRWRDGRDRRAGEPKPGCQAADSGRVPSAGRALHADGRLHPNERLHVLTRSQPHNSEPLPLLSMT